MAFLTVTYSFANSTTADGTQVNTNFTDVINATSDGTKDLNMNAATFAGAVAFNGNTTIGNASADDLTINASLASTVVIKTNASFNIGDATHGLAGIYLGNSTFTTKFVAANSASYTVTYPATAGSAGQVWQNQGSATLAWAPGQTTANAVSSANYAMTDTDGYKCVLMTTAGSNRTATLPAPATNSGRSVTIKKVDSGTGKVTITRNASETIDGVAANIDLFLIGDMMTLYCDGTNWHITADTRATVVSSAYVTASSANVAFANATFETIDFDVEEIDSHSVVTTGASWLFTAPRAGKYRIVSNFLTAGNTNWGVTEQIFVSIRKNGSAYRTANSYCFTNGTPSSISPDISIDAVLSLASGDTIDIQGREDSGTGLNVETGSKAVWVSIEEIR